MACLVRGRHGLARTTQSSQFVTMKFSAFFAVAALINVVRSQDLSQLPQCGQTCINNVLNLAQGSFGCTAGDFVCYCTDENFGYGIRDCANEACSSQSDAASVIAWATAFCEQALSSTASAESQSATSAIRTSAAVASVTSESPTTVPSFTSTSGSTTASRLGPSTSSSFAASASPPTVSSSSSSSKSLSAGAAAGIAVGVTLVVVLTVIGAFILWRRKKKAATAPTHPGSIHPGGTDKEVVTTANESGNTSAQYHEMDAHDARMRHELEGRKPNYDHLEKSELAGIERFEMPR
ncbi:hypothetical protein BDV96DRAFT_679448 [Lophiotrema nucula]|uniref:CFEM domain-containing protein n=1 Tax=Lophiotrema nucula TaxID=690887 RepID=A0A6A5ZFB4_9PLEO|nr:hypothetical protein BDV96DRAFT_679448 [Lophiotrema nucula]